MKTNRTKSWLKRAAQVTAVVSMMALLGALTPGAARAIQDEEFFAPQHYLCYEAKTKPEAGGPPLTIFSQFGVLEGVAMGDAARFCNPVNKVHGNESSEIYDEDLHYTWYRVPRQPGRPLNERITVTNQFGEQQLKLLRLMFVAIPTTKHAVDGELTHHDEAPFALHYACYNVLGRGPRDGVLLEDQFQEMEKRVMDPAFYCTPAAVFPPFEVNSANGFESAYGYVCYDTRGPKEPRRTVSIADWITGEQDLTLTKSSLLCVPNDFDPFIFED